MIPIKILCGCGQKYAFDVEPNLVGVNVRNKWSFLALGGAALFLLVMVLPAGAASDLAKVLQRMESSEARGEGFSREMVGARVMALWPGCVWDGQPSRWNNFAPLMVISILPACPSWRRTTWGSTLTDPFDGQPLRYHKKGTGYALYSIGPDLEDDSGERKKGKDGDIVFAVVTAHRRS